MSQFFETILIRDGEAKNLIWHQKRVNESLGLSPNWQLINYANPAWLSKDRDYRLRIDYDKSGVLKVVLQPYLPKGITGLQLVEVPHTFSYKRKFVNRNHLNQIASHLPKGIHPIFIKNGMITDSLYANVVFYDGSKWLTPNTPLLRGTQRERYLFEGLIQEASISKDDINHYQKVGLINALRELDDPLWSFRNEQIIQ